MKFSTVLDAVRVFDEGIHAYRRPSNGDTNTEGLRRYLTLDRGTWEGLGSPAMLLVTVEAADPEIIARIQEGLSDTGTVEVER